MAGRVYGQGLHHRHFRKAPLVKSRIPAPRKGKIRRFSKLTAEVGIGLSSVTIPRSVTSIGNSALLDCSSLAKVIFLGDAPGIFGTDVFLNTAFNFTVYYFECKEGFTFPVWMGYPTIELDCGGGSSVTFPVSLDLTALALSSGSLSPAFNRGIGRYVAHLPFSNSSVSVIATAASPLVALKAQVQGGDPVFFASGVASEPLALALGENLVTITASFGLPGLLITQTYTVSVIRNTAPALLPEWRFQYFGTTENVGDAANGAIPHYDGVPNLLKFAFGLNPTGPDVRRMVPGGTVGLPTGYLHQNGGTVWRVEYLRRKNSGLTYTPKKSTGLASSSFVPIVGTQIITEVPGFIEWERVIVDEPYDSGTTPKLFTVVEVVTP